jgi:hypothetical protein
MTVQLWAPVLVDYYEICERFSFTVGKAIENLFELSEAASVPQQLHALMTAEWLLRRAELKGWHLGAGDHPVDERIENLCAMYPTALVSQVLASILRTHGAAAALVQVNEQAERLRG